MVLLPPGFTLPFGLSLQQLQLAAAPPLPAAPSAGQFVVRVGEGAFFIERVGTSERLEVRNLGSLAVEVLYVHGEDVRARVLTERGVFGYEVLVRGCERYDSAGGDGRMRLEAAGALFGPSMPPGVEYALVQRQEGAEEEPAAGEQMECGVEKAVCTVDVDGGDEQPLEAAEDCPYSPDVGEDLAPMADASFSDPPAELLAWVQTPLNDSASIAALSMSARLVLSDPPLGCSAPSDASAPPSSASAPYASRVVLAHRGDCSFMDKVLAAQAEGAAAVLVVNSRPAVVAQSAPLNAPAPGPDQSELFLMGFDGSQRRVLVPALMLTWRDGQRLQRCIDAAGGGRQQRAEGAGNGSDVAGLFAHIRRYEDVLVASVQSATVTRTATRVTVSGTLSHMSVEVSTGWTVEIAEKENKTFHLSIH